MFTSQYRKNKVIPAHQVDIDAIICIETTEAAQEPLLNINR